jgi:hypothetical protein
MDNMASKSFTPSKPGDGLRAFAVEASATTQLPANDTLQAFHGALLSVRRTGFTLRRAPWTA